MVAATAPVPSPHLSWCGCEQPPKASPCCRDPRNDELPRCDRDQTGLQWDRRVHSSKRGYLKSINGETAPDICLSRGLPRDAAFLDGSLDIALARFFVVEPERVFRSNKGSYRNCTVLWAPAQTVGHYTSCMVGRIIALSGRLSGSTTHKALRGRHAQGCRMCGCGCGVVALCPKCSCKCCSVHN
jgi:hypothetical protein